MELQPQPIARLRKIKAAGIFPAMAFFLKELSIAIGLLTSDNAPVADADGWKNYVWRVRPIDQCIATDERGFCRIVDDRWDWKRDQRYSFSFRLDQATNGLTGHLRLDNSDPRDDDFVCIVAIFTDRNDKEVAVLYQNWHSLHGRTIERDVPVRPSLPVASIVKVAVGSKQCDAHASPDAANFYRARTELKQR
jgi:hypothetical protein